MKGVVHLKKNFTVIIITIIILFGFIFANLALGEFVLVEVFKPSLVNLQDYVSCSGKIEESQKKEYFADGTGIIKKVLVKSGDKVKKDDVLVIYTKTGEKYSTPAVTNSLTNYPSDIDISSILPNYSEQIKNEIAKKNETTTSQNNEPQEIIITANFDATVTEVNAVEGVSLNSSKPLITISDFSALQIKTNINESLVTKIKIGQKAIISGDGFKNSIYYGLVESISPIAKQVINTGFTETVVETIIKINNDNKSVLRPGFTASIKILVNEKPNVLLASYDSILQDEEQNEYVFKIFNGKPFKQPIKTGIENEDGVEIIEGLNAQDIIISNPNEKLNANSKVKPLRKVGK